MMTIRVDAKDDRRDLVFVQKDGRTVARGSVTLVGKISDTPGVPTRYRLVSHMTREKWEVSVPSRDAATANLTGALIAAL